MASLYKAFYLDSFGTQMDCQRLIDRSKHIIINQQKLEPKLEPSVVAKTTRRNVHGKIFLLTIDVMTFRTSPTGSTRLVSFNYSLNLIINVTAMEGFFINNHIPKTIFTIPS